MSKTINDQIVEYQQSQQEAAEALSQAQSRVAELQACYTARQALSRRYSAYSRTRQPTATALLCWTQTPNQRK